MVRKGKHNREPSVNRIINAKWIRAREMCSRSISRFLEDRRDTQHKIIDSQFAVLPARLSSFKNLFMRTLKKRVSWKSWLLLIRVHDDFEVHVDSTEHNELQ